MKFYILIKHEGDCYGNLGKIHIVFVSSGYNRNSINKKHELEYQNEHNSIKIIPHYRRSDERLEDNLIKIEFSFHDKNLSLGGGDLQDLLAKLKKEGLNIEGVKDIRTKIVNL